VGNAALVFAPGRYTLGRLGKLTAATVPGLPVDPSELSDALGDEVSAWLAEQVRPSIGEQDRGQVATLNRAATSGNRPLSGGPFGS
jgi:hypothetical protein